MCEKKGSDQDIHTSGVAAVCFCTLNNVKSKTGWKWGKEHSKIVCASKPNIIN